MQRRSNAPATQPTVLDGELDESCFQERGEPPPRQTSANNGSPAGDLDKSVASSTTHVREAPPLCYKALQEYQGVYPEERVEPAGSGSPFLRIAHSRQQSFTDFLPLSIRNRLSTPESPKLQQQTSRLGYEPSEDEMALTGEGRRMKRTPSRESSGAPESSSANTTPTKSGKNQSAADDTTPKNSAPATTPAAPSRIAQFASSIFSKTAPTTDPATYDALLTLNVEEALFPGGVPSGKDTFSPAAMKNLQTNAMGLLTKMQNALNYKHTALQEMEKEREAQEEEREECETRARHFKMQLEDMAHKALQQEMLMKQLVEDFEAERRARADERAMFLAREKAMAITDTQSEESTIDEDLDVDDDQQKRVWRASNGTVRSDTSFETDIESVFSRPRSASRATSFEGSVIDAPVSRPKGAPSAAAPRPKSTQQMTTFQKLIKNISGDAPGSGCQNCRGQDASMAWDTVGLLRDENRGLKQRVGELEDAVDGALDLVNGYGILDL